MIERARLLLLLFLSATAACSGGTSSSSGGGGADAASDASSSSAEGGGSSDGQAPGDDTSGEGSGASEAGGDACMHSNGGPAADAAPTADGGCDGLQGSDCYTCCTNSYPQGASAYDTAYQTCACSLCASSCPVSCGCGMLQDETCDNCIYQYESMDAGCFPAIDSTCQSNPACSTWVSCVTNVCHLTPP